MANVKISQLPAATSVTGDDLLPIVENGATQTQKAEFSQVLSYITSSTFDTLTVTSLTASMEGNASTSDQVNTQDASAAASSKNITFVENLTGYQDVETDSTLTYVPASNRLNVNKVRLSLGSTSDPIITTEDPGGPGGANDTGIYFPDKDTIGFTVDNSQKVRVDGAGLFVNGEITSSYFRVDSGEIRTSNTSGPIYLMDTDTTFSGVEVLLSVQNNGSEQFYVRRDGYVRANSILAVPNVNIWPSYGLRTFGYTSNLEGDGGISQPAVRVGNNNNSTTEVALAVSTNLSPSTTPNDVLVVYGNGDTDVSGSLVADVEVSSEITSATYTLSSTDRGKTLLFNSGTAQTITCPSGLDTGFNVTAIQLGTGQLNFVGSGVTLVNRFGHSSSAGQYSAVSVIVLNGTQYLIVGDTA